MLRRSVSRHAKPCAPSDIQVSIPYLLVHPNKAPSTLSRAAVCVAGRVIPAMCGSHKAKNRRNYRFARTIWESCKVAGPGVDAVFPLHSEKLATDWSRGLGNEAARGVSGGFAESFIN